MLIAKAVTASFTPSILSSRPIVLAGGEGHPNGLGGYFVKPTLFANVTNGMTIVREEIFGPVLCLLTYRTEE